MSRCAISPVPGSWARFLWEPRRPGDKQSSYEDTLPQRSWPSSALPLRGDAVAQRFADDLYPAFRAEFGQDAGDVGLHSPPRQEHALGDVRRRVAAGEQGGDLDLGRSERLPARGGPRLAPTAGTAPDAVGAKPTLGPADVPPGLQAVVEADSLVQRRPGFLVPVALGQHDRQ